MKYLKEELDIKAGIKKFKNWYNYRDIYNICKKYNIRNYHINDDGTVDVDGFVSLKNKGLDKIPLKFGEVSGWFICSGNNLKDLIGSPKRVGQNFICSYNNKLTSLKGCPTYIGGKFSCIGNKKLWSFDYFPRHAKKVDLGRTPILHVFNLFRTVYLEDGGKYFTTSGSMMDYFWDCDPVYPGGIIKKRRLENFLASIDKELNSYHIDLLKQPKIAGFIETRKGWKIED